jgi:UDP-N-acetylglucosamine--N-acetylmuramyl-(pentapeptide) pyrophosphoryl-undecaprenol N-acetylglucosamine transferase
LSYSFVMAGAGGTGGHIFPSLAVARVLKSRGHQVLFIGTSDGMEARIIPHHGFAMEFVRSGGVNRVGFRKRVWTAFQLPLGVAAALRIFLRHRPQAVFSMGGYVAVPVLAAALLLRVPLVVMEPNAVPGIANRIVGKRVYRALLGFESARRWFPRSKSEVTGLPIRSEFFSLAPKTEGPFTVLVTGGSLGSRTLNRASRESWRLFRERASSVRIIHQTGRMVESSFAEEFSKAGIGGRVVEFIQDMPAVFAEADLVVGRSGAGGVNEIAAAGKPSVLVPFPFSTDDHQKKNAEALANAGAAILILDAEMNGERLFREVEALRADPKRLAEMRSRVRQFAKPGAAERAAEVLEQAAAEKSGRNR